MNKLIKYLLSGVVLLSLVACDSSDSVIVPEEPVCSLTVGVVMSVEGIDYGYNKLVWDGVKSYAESVNLSSSCYQYLEASYDDESYTEYLRTFADKMDFVIAADPHMVDDVVKVAKEYRNITFLIVDDIVNLQNVVSLNYDVSFATFLAGVLATNYALQLGSYNLGYIGEDDTLAAIFEQGAKQMNSNIHVTFKNDENADFEETYVYYYENDSFETISEESSYINIRSSDLNSVITKDISEDIFNILKSKERKKLVVDAYNSKDYVITDVDFSYLTFECKKIVSKSSFEYTNVPSYLIPVEEEVIATESDVDESEGNEDSKTVESKENAND